MDKHPKEMTSKELVKKLKDGVNAKAASTVVGEKLSLLFLSKSE